MLLLYLAKSAEFCDVICMNATIYDVQSVFVNAIVNDGFISDQKPKT